MRRRTFSRREPRSDAPQALDLAEEAVHLVRQAPPRILAAYYVGSMPFVLGLLYYFADMAHAGDAAARCSQGALGLTVLYVWMKYWHVVYCRGLRAVAARDAGVQWTRSTLWRMAVRQAILQPTSLVVLPVSLLILAPYPWVHALYYSVTAMDCGDESTPRQLVERAWAQARLWPAQNHVLMWLFSPGLLALCAVTYLAALPALLLATPMWADYLAWTYAIILALSLVPLSPLGVVLAANIAVAVTMAPMLLRSLLGIETLFSLDQGSLFSSLFVAAVCSLAYLALDPLMRAAYVLRCFYGESLATGEDLRVALRTADEAYEERVGTGRRGARASGALRMGVTMLLAGAAALFACDAAGQGAMAEVSPGIAAGDLEQAIETVLQQREYLWRLPREYPTAEDEGALSGFLNRIAETLSEWTDAVLRTVARWIRWLRELFGETTPTLSPGGTDWGRTVATFGVGLLSLAVVLMLILVVRLWRRSRLETVEAAPAEPETEVDLEDEDVAAEDLPEDRWMALAEDLARRGEYRLALRALFLGGLARLETMGLVRLARGKTNRDYLVELVRRSGALPHAPDAFRRCIRLFEGVWYGSEDATADLLGEFSSVQQRMTHGQAQ